MTVAFGNHIAGEWLKPANAAANINPSNVSDSVGEFAMGSVADADAAVAAAKAAFRAWSRTTPYERGLFLKKVAAELTARSDKLGRQLSREEGKPLAEGVGEILRAAQMFDYYAGETVRIAGETMAGLRPGVTAQVLREPAGVVAAITPWNFPIGLPAAKIAAALCYGNTLVFKPAELVPATAWALTDILARVGLPAGVFNLVMGEGHVVGKRLTEHRDVDAVTFTGSVPTGRIVAAAAIASENMKKIQLELGGKNPLLVLDDADLDNAVECAIDGAFFATGQRCTASSRLIVTEAIHDRFVAALRERMAKLVVDNALKDGTQIGPVVDQDQLDIDLSYIDIGRKEGARVAAGGERLKRDHDGFYLAPTLFVDATPDMRISREEIFGPVAAVMRVKDYDEALAVANDTNFGLSSGICTTSLKHAEHFKANSQTGVVKVNLSTSGVDFHLPFGGRKASSYGAREQGAHVRDFFTTLKTAYQLAL
ncbi:MAG TPA: aldehyde dehydrogenase family protein [Caulobacteraceae bacterium]|jgi:aldehyde dehydrogenase (NAD+)